MVFCYFVLNRFILTISGFKAFASWANKSFKTAMDPLSAAICNGVRPSVIFKCVSAPDFNNILVHFSPRASSIRAEMCNGASPMGPPIIGNCERFCEFIYQEIFFIYFTIPLKICLNLPLIWTWAPWPSTDSTTAGFPASTAKCKAV